MINIIPQSELRLLKTPLEKDSEHTLSFPTISDQSAYFLSRVQKSYSEFTYIREQQAIVVPDNYDSIYTCNYLMYRNNGFNNKYFYAFITKMEYVSENSTRIYFEIDSLQTWYFNIAYKDVFIEREHVADDTVGLHTLPEGLETGEYIESASATKTSVTNDYYLCFCVTKDMDGNSMIGNNLNGIFNGLAYYLVRGNDHGGGNVQHDPKLVVAGQLMIYWYAVKNQLQQDNIESVFLVPRGLIDENSLIWSSYTVATGTRSFNAALIEDNEVLKTITQTVSVPSSLAGTYTPINNKLKCFPYRYMLASNNSGMSVAYHYELFNSDTMNFDIKGVVTPGCEIKLIPKNYKNNSFNYNESLSFGKIPVCSWAKDTYLNWQTQNALNNNLGVIGGVAKTVVGFGSGNVEAGASGLGDILSVAKTEYEHEFAPNQAMGNTNCGDINFASGYDEISFIHLSIKPEYARIIDNYFSKFGYKVNRVGYPNFHTRRNWNYIKTIECNFSGDIPQEDLQKIKDIFNRGITFWHNANNFLDYSVSNDII